MRKVIYILWVLALVVAFYIFGYFQGGKPLKTGNKAAGVTVVKDSVVTDSLVPVTMDVQDDNDSFHKAVKIKKALNNSLYQERRNLITETVANKSNAVVGINVIQLKKYVRRSPLGFDDPFWRMFAPELFRDREMWQKVRSLGSGFIISSDGYIVTNEHVVEDAAQIVVTTTDGEKHQAKLIGSDKVSDIALLKIDGKNYEFLKFSDSNDIMIGEWCIAMGNPFGLFELNNKPTVTVGVVSAVDRDWGRVNQSGRVYQDMIQTDAAINHGNSGGPLLNILGECIGMNTFIFTGNSNSDGFVGIGFAIPANKINEIVRILKNNGKVDRDFWTGIEIQQIDAITAQALGLEFPGVLVISIDKDSPAEKAGVKQDDVIIAIAGKPVASFKDAQQILTNLGLRVGDILELTVLRDGKKIVFKLKLEKLPKK